jgi:hypothetical protein
MVLFVLNANQIVYLKSLVIILISVPTYVKIAHFFFWVVLGDVFLLSFFLVFTCMCGG